MWVTVWGGPKDGQMINVNAGTSEWKVPTPSRNLQDWLEDPEPSTMPTYKVDTYKIMNTTKGLRAVHPSINTESLT